MDNTYLVGSHYVHIVEDNQLSEHAKETVNRIVNDIMDNRKS